MLVHGDATADRVPAGDERHKKIYCDLKEPHQCKPGQFTGFCTVWLTRSQWSINKVIRQDQ